MFLVPVFLSDFGVGPYIFFCLELVPALCKNIGIDPSLNFLLKKTQNYWYWSLHFIKILVLIPALCKNIGIGATWHWSLHFFCLIFFLRATWREMIEPHGILLVSCFFFNRKFTEGSIPIFLQSAGTNAKQKKVQGPMPKSDKNARTNNTFKRIMYY